MAIQLQLQGLTKVFGARPREALAALQASASKAELLERTGLVLGVHNASLTVEAGELFVIMGLSGSGKSTLVRLINRLIEPDAGRIVLDGIDVTALSPRELVRLRRQRMSMVFQSFALLPHRSVLDNTCFGLEVAGVKRAEAQRRAAAVLEMVGISQVADHRPAQLSGGMQQRVGLARAWVTEPQLMLMDEAFSALDPLIRTEMQDALRALQREQRRTILFISHDLTEAARIADRIAVMAEGEIRQVGTVREIIARPADAYVRAFFRDVPLGRLLTAGEVAERKTVSTDVAPVSADLSLEALLPIAAGTEQPIPVHDSQDGLIGYIDRPALLQALAGVPAP